MTHTGGVQADLQGVVIPAAGLGTRVAAVAQGRSKEMLPLGQRPLIDGALLEAEAADLRPVVVVAPRKQDLVSHLRGRALLAEQSEPAGAMDAVWRGRQALGGGPVAVLYPDYVHLPDQRALSAIAAAWRQTRGCVYGLLRPGEDAHLFGRTVRVEASPHAPGVHRITAVHGACAPAPGALHTTFAEVRDADFDRACAEVYGEGRREDAGLLTVLELLCRWGRLFAAEIEGQLLDTGTLPGYEAALARFDAGATWRADPLPQSPGRLK